MRRWAEEIDKRKYDLGMAALFEVGKSRLEAIGEAEEAVDLVAWYADEMERNEGFTQQMRRAVPEEETVCRLRPVGVFGVIAPFNFSVALPCNMLGACLVAGNTAVFKPSPGAGLTGSLLVEAAIAAGLPAGVLNLVCGEEAGRCWWRPTASTASPSPAPTKSACRSCARWRAGRSCGPVICEMGGKNPTYVTANADLDLAADGLARSAFGLQGEKCSACSVAYVERPVYEDFLAAEGQGAGAEDRQSGRQVGVHRAGDRRGRGRPLRARRRHRAPGGPHRARRRAPDRRRPRQRLLRRPDHRRRSAADHWLNREELFLPFVSVNAVDSLEEGLRRGNAVIYGLTAGFYGDETELETFLDKAEAGVLYANRRSGATTGAWPGFQTFCGWKGSGVDSKGGLGPYTIPRYMREQSLTVMRR
jgi:1-pyrroline-5-carboxylate dehydrogenase